MHRLLSQLGSSSSESASLFQTSPHCSCSACQLTRSRYRSGLVYVALELRTRTLLTVEVYLVAFEPRGKITQKRTRPILVVHLFLNVWAPSAIVEILFKDFGRYS
jgi:hypothetical protein